MVQAVKRRPLTVFRLQLQNLLDITSSTVQGPKGARDVVQLKPALPHGEPRNISVGRVDPAGRNSCAQSFGYVQKINGSEHRSYNRLFAQIAAAARDVQARPILGTLSWRQIFAASRLSISEWRGTGASLRWRNL